MFLENSLIKWRKGGFCITMYLPILEGSEKRIINNFIDLPQDAFKLDSLSFRCIVPSMGLHNTRILWDLVRWIRSHRRWNPAIIPEFDGRSSVFHHSRWQNAEHHVARVKHFRLSRDICLPPFEINSETPKCHVSCQLFLRATKENYALYIIYMYYKCSNIHKF